ncbi:MAG: hypothetical protein F6K26_53620, partial [Moorea sp. SIO2I5]|nr:hypothetical protein [Moorena sp. SIO2I5]
HSRHSSSPIRRLSDFPSRSLKLLRGNRESGIGNREVDICSLLRSPCSLFPVS